MTAAIRRLAAEQKAMMDPQQRSADYFAAPLEDNIYEWHFTIRGPYASPTDQAYCPRTAAQEAEGPVCSPFPSSNTTCKAFAETTSGGEDAKEDEGKLVSSPSTSPPGGGSVSAESDVDCPSLGYEKGLYHGALIFTTEFPFSPPDIMFFTPSGRFECNTKICSSISRFHKEHWQPSYTISFILESLREFMRTEEEEGLGRINPNTVSRAQKSEYAAQSWNFKCKVCGCLSYDTYSTYMAPYISVAGKETKEEEEKAASSGLSEDPQPLTAPAASTTAEEIAGSTSQAEILTSSPLPCTITATPVATSEQPPSKSVAELLREAQLLRQARVIPSKPSERDTDTETEMSVDDEDKIPTAAAAVGPSSKAASEASQVDGEEEHTGSTETRVTEAATETPALIEPPLCTLRIGSSERWQLKITITLLDKAIAALCVFCVLIILRRCAIWLSTIAFNAVFPGLA